MISVFTKIYPALTRIPDEGLLYAAVFFLTLCTSVGQSAWHCTWPSKVCIYNITLDTEKRTMGQDKADERTAEGEWSYSNKDSRISRVAAIQ